jgi:hypothetical protein
MGWGGTAPLPSLERLDIATAMPAAFRLGIGAVALPTRGARPVQSFPSSPVLGAGVLVLKRSR